MQHAPGQESVSARLQFYSRIYRYLYDQHVDLSIQVSSHYSYFQEGRQKQNKAGFEQKNRDPPVLIGDPPRGFRGASSH